MNHVTSSVWPWAGTGPLCPGHRRCTPTSQAGWKTWRRRRRKESSCPPQKYHQDRKNPDTGRMRELIFHLSKTVYRIFRILKFKKHVTFLTQHVRWARVILTRSNFFCPFSFHFFYSLPHNSRITIDKIPTVSKKKSPCCCSWVKTASSGSPSVPDMVAGEPAGAVTVTGG